MEITVYTIFCFPPEDLENSTYLFYQYIYILNKTLDIFFQIVLWKFKEPVSQQ